MREDERRTLIAAYLRERRGQESRGRHAHVALIDEELAKLGYKPEPEAVLREAEAPVEVAVDSAPVETAARARGRR